jgi:predicted AlkP superfamily phosphohydrolase/phosphomutase
VDSTAIENLPRERLLREVLFALAGWGVIGASVGALIGAFSVRINSSLQGPGQALPFVLLTTATYAVILSILGLVTAIAAHFASRTPPTFVVHARAAMLCSAGFVAGQYTISHVTWRTETSGLNIACSLALGLALAIAARLWLAPGKKFPRVGFAPILVPACAVFALVSIRHEAPAHAAELAQPAAPLAVAHDANGEIPRVMLIGVDGADWGRLLPLMQAGRLPNFSRLCDGAFSAPLETTKPTWSPIVWTTIATGVREDNHGVLDFTEVELPGLSRGLQRGFPKYRSGALLPRDVGLAAMIDALVDHDLLRKLPISALHRRHKAIWNVLADLGVKCGIVRWWATWPAEEIDGWLISDNDPLMQAFAAERTPHMSVKATTANMTFPLELADEMIPLIARDGAIVSGHDDFADRLLADPIFADLTPDELDKLHAEPDGLSAFEIIVRGDQFANRAALKLWNERKVSLLAVYLRAVDNLSHRFGHCTGVVDHTYEFMDRRIGELLDAGGKDTTYLLVSDHGWCYKAGDQFGHFQGQAGVMILKGPSVVPAASDAKPSVLDVAPTILALYGLSPSSDMTGKPLTQLFASGSTPATARERISSYGGYKPRWPHSIGNSDAGRMQAVELLKRIGYL